MLDAEPHRVSRQERVLVWFAIISVVAVFALAVLNWIGWVTGNDGLTRLFPSWPHTPPLSAAIQAALGLAILVQLSQPSPTLVWSGRVLAAAAGVSAVVFGAETASSIQFGLGRISFSEALQAAQLTAAGRPSMWTSASAASLAIAVGVIHIDRPWTRFIWPLSLIGAALLPSVTAVIYVFQAFLLMDVNQSTRQSLASAVSLLLLTSAAIAARPDRLPLAWLLSRPDRWTLIRLVSILAGLPLVIGSWRLLYLKVGVTGEAAWVLSITVGTVFVGAGVFFASQREQRLLIEKETLSRDRAEAEARYRLVLEAAPDALIVVGPDGRIMFANARSDDMFGYPRNELVGGEVEGLLPARFRNNHRHHRATYLGDPTVRPMGTGLELSGLRRDGTEFPVSISLSPMRTGPTMQVLAAIRDVTERNERERQFRHQHDELIEAHRQLERLAHYDSLTGLFSRAEVLARLESNLSCVRRPGSACGVLFCDVDKFKTVNDTRGHAVGDAVLATLADRIRRCVRDGDTVGRTGGDEILVLLPGLHSLDEAAQIANKIRVRAAEPIHHNGKTLYATLSIGATLAIPGESVTDATARADAAMYQAKAQGGNHVSCF
ncbi:MAG: diguanylate cyclase [Mycobacterium sp.]|nr:diguanylate cyclase [Mycobacterium sp.]